jgi:DNA-binding winged helix-turn-helix (wHTH) protein/Tol biopolymer transport system component
VRFGEFELDLSTRELWTNGTKQTLAPQPFQVLELLIENRGELVSHDVVVRHLWPSDTFVDYEQSLRKAVNRLREALKDSAEASRFIETLPRQGYRFIANLEFDTAVRDRLADPVIVMPKRVPDEPDAKVTQPLDDSAVRGRIVEPMVVRPRRPRDEHGADATRRNSITSHLLWVSAVVVLGVVGTVLWRSRVSRHTQSAVAEPKITQLIANSFENPMTSSAISPDGKYLAFTDNTRRMRVRLMETGETHTIPEPESLRANSVDWAIAAWFPDSTRFIANARPHGSFAWFPTRFRFAANTKPTGSTDTRVNEASSIWIVSVLGNAPQKLRDDADAFSVSSDGSLIAFGTNAAELGDREIWLMDAKGLQARKLYDAPEKTAIGDLQWSGDGQRAIYLEVGADSRKLVSRDFRGGPAVPLVENQGDPWLDFVSLPDGRLIYGSNGNFWELRIHPRNGAPTGEPRQLTNWSALWPRYMSVTSDGKHLAFQRRTRQVTINIADIEANANHLSPARHFTVNEYSNFGETWTPDSKALVFRSSRDGHGKLFKQTLNSDIEEPLVMGAENVGGSAISPNGSWLFYLDCTGQAKANTPCTGITPVMRIPIHGGEPHQVLASDTYGRPRCTFSPADLCVIAEQSADGRPLILTAFDALKGRGAEIARFETETAADYSWGLSPDGTRVAILKRGDNRIHIVSLKGEAPQEVAVKHWTNLLGVVYWAADGKGWFTSSSSEMGVVLLYVDLQGEAHPLWSLNGGGSLADGLPSPDGRHLAIVATTWNNNIWLIENF